MGALNHRSAGAGRACICFTPEPAPAAAAARTWRKERRFMIQVYLPRSKGSRVEGVPASSASQTLTLTLVTQGSPDKVTITLTSAGAIADILDIAIGEEPSALAALGAQTQQVLKQEQSINTQPPKPPGPKP